jgi:hypothetical protein
MANIVYLDGDYSTINGTPASGLAHVRIDDASVDARWTRRIDLPPFAGSPLHDLDADGGSVYAVRYTGPTLSDSSPVAIVQGSAQGDASTYAELATDARVDFPALSSSAPRNLRVVALPDGRALVAGAYTTIGGVHRDGFAVIGPAERLFMDGFD